MLVIVEAVVAIVVLIAIFKYLDRWSSVSGAGSQLPPVSRPRVERRSGQDRRARHDRRDGYFNRTGRSGRRSGRDRRRSSPRQNWLQDSR